ncbi:MAG: hypothetical protein ABW167_07725 [Baekduia sp.]
MTEDELRVARVVTELIVERGLSYADAIAECERLAEKAAAPYRTAAAKIRADLERCQRYG